MKNILLISTSGRAAGAAERFLLRAGRVQVRLAGAEEA